ncbi:MAG: hypothetical protein K6E65_05015 [Olsenella sp.]|nr:hypothetical protein [Olsenella sp.]
MDVSDHTQEWLSALAPALLSGLEQVGLAAEGHAKARCPVDTGRLAQLHNPGAVGQQRQVV